MATIDGGEDSRLAPVIPLFGRGRLERPVQRERLEPELRAPEPREVVQPTPRREADGPESAEPQPVWHASWVTPPSAPRSDDGLRAAGDVGGSGSPAPDVAEVRAAGEQALLRRLRTRQLSVSEARTMLRDSEVDAEGIDELLDSFARHGYLDDAALADSLVYAAVERKGQGRAAIAPLLTKRGIPREVADAALATLPDDEAERALDFARTKARVLGSRDRETALRRLTGQLARRGYPSSVSLSAARQALDEVGTRGGVRFD